MPSSHIAANQAGPSSRCRQGTASVKPAATLTCVGPYSGISRPPSLFAAGLLMGFCSMVSSRLTMMITNMPASSLRRNVPSTMPMPPYATAALNSPAASRAGRTGSQYQHTTAVAYAEISTAATVIAATLATSRWVRG